MLDCFGNLTAAKTSPHPHMEEQVLVSSSEGVTPSAPQEYAVV